MLILPQTDAIAFIDESGDFELAKLNPAYPICAQCALTCTVDQYLANAVPNLMKIKYHFFGNECVVIHGHKLRKRSVPFNILADPETFGEFMNALKWAFDNIDGQLIASAVDKPRHKEQYANPNDPFFLSLQFLLERLNAYWRGKLTAKNRLLCVFEQRGAKEDRKTLEWFREICDGRNFRSQKFHFDADFRPKDQNVIGHQYADLAAYAICRYVESRDENRKDWLAIKDKMWRVGNVLIGHGLKIFPN